MATSFDGNKNTRKAEWLVGLATYGAAFAGTLGLLLALFGLLSGRLEAAGACLIAAAVAFGALANALLRE